MSGKKDYVTMVVDNIKQKIQKKNRFYVQFMKPLFYSKKKIPQLRLVSLSLQKLDLRMLFYQE